MVNVFHFSPVNAGHTRHVLLTADSLRKQPVPNLPSEHGRVLLLVLANRVHDMRRGHLRLRPPDHPRLEVASLVKSGRKGRLGFLSDRISTRNTKKLFVS